MSVVPFSLAMQECRNSVVVFEQSGKNIPKIQDCGSFGCKASSVSLSSFKWVSSFN